MASILCPLTVLGSQVKYLSNTLKTARIIFTLRTINSEACLSLARKLEEQPTWVHSYDLILRDAGISDDSSFLLALAIKETHRVQNIHLNIFSISYNRELTIVGLVALLESLPDNVTEFGAVNCDLDGAAGEHLVSFISRANKLKVICVEGSFLSSAMASKISGVARHLPGCLIVV